MAKPLLKVEDYAVGWICAITVELAAVTKLLDEEHQDLPQNPHDNNSYTFGRIGEHNVVIACMPEGGVGTTWAAAVASQMQSQFTSIRFGLMVGVGGGVPSDSNDVRLGDVVISMPQGQHGGVVQYNFGKAGKDGKVARTGWLNAPPTILLTALTKLRTNNMIGRVDLAKHLSAFNDLPEFKYQGVESDVLYKAAHDHADGPTCENCGIEEVVKRNNRESILPALHFGNIASDNQVMKDGITRDRYSKELGGVLCFEMEAAGLMNTFPCLVIRGICDYSDSHKNKRWQPHAAAAAAAVAKELLYIMPASRVVETPTVGEMLDGKTGEIMFCLFLLIDWARRLIFDISPKLYRSRRRRWNISSGQHHSRRGGIQS
jgi:nucleoside phosphorylase